MNAPRLPHASRRSVVTLIALTVALASVAGIASAHGRRGRSRHSLSGTVAAIDAASSSFTLSTRGGKTITVQTNEATTFTKTVQATVADATAGKFVVAWGERPDEESLAAEKLAIVDTTGAHHGRSDDERVAGWVVSNDGSTLTVDVDKDGTADETVTTTADTRVWRTYSTTFSELAVGDLVRVKGRRTAEGTFLARAVHIGGKAPKEPKPTPTPTASPATATKVSDASSDSAGERVRVSGRIASVGDGSFTIAKGESSKTVTWSGATTFIETVGATLADVNAGDRISAWGYTRDDGPMFAKFVHLREVASEEATEFSSHKGWNGFVLGRVTSVDRDRGLIAVQTARGSRAVAVNDDTLMTRTKPGSSSDLAVGRFVKVVGTAADDGTIEATKVHVIATPARPAGLRRTGDSGDRDWSGDGDRSWSGDRDGRRRSGGR